MKKLQLTFLNSLGKNHALTVSTVAENLTEEQIRTQMTALGELNLFSTTEATLYVKPVSAKYVETLETDVF
ncbi:MAG: DUF2922 domain-containing protein [Enterococcus sp.]